MLTSSIFVDQPRARPALHRLAAVLARDRGRHHAAAPARGRDHEPRDRIAAARPARGAGETARLHRGPRRHRGAPHRQDRNAHRRHGSPSSARSTPTAPRRRRSCATDSSATRRPSRTARRSAATRSTLALWDATGSAEHRTARRRRASRSCPFDHDRRMTSVLVDEPDRGRILVTKGAPEASSPAAIECRRSRARDARRRVRGRQPGRRGRLTPGAAASTTLDARRRARPRRSIGFLVFLDQAEAGAAASLARLADLGITVKVVTGDNPALPRRCADDLGLAVRRHAHRRRHRGARRRRACERRVVDRDDLRPGQPGAEGATHPRASRRRAAMSRSSATASTTRSRCTPPMSASRSNRAPTSRRTRPTSCCSRRTSACSPRASPKGGARSRTRSSTC